MWIDAGRAAAMVVMLAAAAMAGDPVTPEVEAGQTVLGGGSYFRALAMWRDPGVGPLKGLKTEPPPAGWVQADFDDRDWYRSAGPLTGEDIYRGALPDPKVAFCGLLCMRSRFMVEKPGSVTGLALSLRIRGGAVAYLNGREVARVEMPDGATTPETPGGPYSTNAYASAKLERSIGPVNVPVSLLRPGVNVLAIEVHGSDFPAAPPRKPEPSLAGLCALRLSATGSGIVPNVDRPAGFRVFNIDPNHIFTVMEYADPCEPLRPIRLCGARNGSYSGAVVASSTAAIENLRATMSDLAQAGGSGKIPAASVVVRYGTLSDREPPGSKAGLSREAYRWTIPPAFSGLEKDPPASVSAAALAIEAAERADLGLPPKPTPGAVVPVWVTVTVPGGIPAGKYAGTLTLAAAGVPGVATPVEVEVADWTIPDAKKTFVGLYQSPETLAEFYKVGKWSEPHWSLIEESFKLAGQAYNHLLVLPLLEKSQTGNDESLVIWEKQPDGSFRFDTARLDRMLDIASKHCRLKAVVAQLTHGPYMGEWGTTKLKNPDDSGMGFGGVRNVTCKDASGALSSMRLMDYGTPESRAALKALTGEIRARLKAKGVEDAFVFGTNQDTGMDKETAAFFKEIQPQAGWHYAAHGRRDGSVYAYVEYLYVDNYLSESPGKQRKKPANSGTIVVMSQRMYGWQQPPLALRTMMERAGILGDSGAGRMGIDYWSFPKGQGGGGWNGTFFSRWPNSTAGQRSPHLSAVALPGRSGPISSCKLEALREGVQENEAVVLIRDALDSGRLSAELAERVRRVLAARHSYGRMIHGNQAELRATIGEGDYRRSWALYTIAAEVARRAGD